MKCSTNLNVQIRFDAQELFFLSVRGGKVGEQKTRRGAFVGLKMETLHCLERQVEEVLL